MTVQTPMLKQYRGIKARYGDALVLYRLGDFYELFEADAELVARQLGLVLTSRRFSKRTRLPMCGIPHHRLNTYVARLIQLGHKVAIVEQLEDARQAKGLVKRDVVRVITPGTVVEESLLRDYDDKENLLAGVVVSFGQRGCPDGYGVAVIDLATGVFKTTQIVGPDAENSFWEELARLGPSEIVLARSLAQDETFTALFDRFHPFRLSPLDDVEFGLQVTTERLKTHFGVVTLEGYGCEQLPLALMAAGGVLGYLQNNQLSELAHITRLETCDLAIYMTLDDVSRRNLELTCTLRDGRRAGSLLEQMDCTLSAMGRRMLRRWLVQPLLDLETIQARHDAVQELFERAWWRDELRDVLDGVYDLERLVGRIGFGSANARDLVALRNVLERVPRLQTLLADAQSARLCDLRGSLDSDALHDIVDLISRAIVEDPPILIKDGGLITSAYHAELARLRQVADQGRDWLAQFEAEQREQTGIKTLRVRYNQVFGFFIEVTKSNLHLVPADYERRATVRHAERFVTPALKACEIDILTAEDQGKALEYELFVEIRQYVAARSDLLSRTAHVLAELDTLAALARVAAINGYVRPTMDSGNAIVVHQGWHPVVESMLADGERFVPNDATFSRDERLLILTGPNMSGKSVYVRQVALIVLLAQMGSFVPAAKAQIGLADRIFVRAGASDDITRGRSTFLVEMSETSYILRHATERSLVILDEVGRGTSTYDGMSLAWAVAEDLHNTIGARTLFATHFHELTRLAESLEAARNYTLAVVEKDNRVVFLRQLVAGGVDKSYGIQVARLAGLPERVIDRAGQVLARLEQEDRRPSGDVYVPEPERVWLMNEPLLPTLYGIDETSLKETLRELVRVDVANITPVQALVILNELQKRIDGITF
ncbi:MAG: DNA mismatch repair protein MutS [Anaerolineae bacterium]|nr:DNA mismatch repair protein MutS [Anaerolineae bacterium]